MNTQYLELLFSELRIITISENECFLEENFIKAITANENLKTLGFTLKPVDIVKLAKSNKLFTIYDEIKSYMGDVKANPMYLDFPSQVLSLTEAQFRIHQLMHYFSTYGIEELLGIEVNKGWLPEVKETNKTESDIQLLKLKVLELVEEKDAYIKPITKILSKRERMSDKEKEIVKIAVCNIEPEEIASLNIPFKQNLLAVFYSIFSNNELSSDKKVELLHLICKHTGDVLKCLDYTLVQCNFHLRTSQKRLLVHLLESYPEKDFASNLILTNKKGERHKLVMQYLDYNVYSRSIAHKKTLESFKNGKLKSWGSKMQYLLKNRDEGALDFISERPGMLLRTITWMLKLDYPADEIKNALIKNSDSLSIQTIVTVMRFMGRERATENGYYSEEIRKATFELLEDVLFARLTTLETPLKGKNVFLDTDDFDLEHSEMEFNEKPSDGGYVLPGLAYRIPDTANFIRLFVYWNDKKRVDVDLHAFSVDKDNHHNHVGWNDDYANSAAVFSGDITHSNAAEYIDINMNSNLNIVNANIDLYSGKELFADINECYVGLMAVNKISEEVKLYDPKNCFFSHKLKSKDRYINYGYVDVQNKFILFLGKNITKSFNIKSVLTYSTSKMNLKYYLDTLFKAQGAKICTDEENADIILTIGKSEKENGISLIDENYFID